MNWRWLVGGSAGGGGRRSRGVTGTCQPARGVRRDTGSGTCCCGDSRVLPGPRRQPEPGACAASIPSLPAACGCSLMLQRREKLKKKKINKIRLRGWFQQRGPCRWLDPCTKRWAWGVLFFVFFFPSSCSVLFGCSVRGSACQVCPLGSPSFSRCWRQVEASAAPCGTCPRLGPAFVPCSQARACSRDCSGLSEGQIQPSLG